MIQDEALTSISAAQREWRLLLVWGDLPFAPEERPPRNPARLIERQQEAARALPALPFAFSHGAPWPLAGLPPLPILSFDPSERVETTFRYAGVPLHVMRTRRDPRARDRHNLLKLGGDLAARAGLLLSWDDVRAAAHNPDKAHLLREARRLVRDGVVLAMVPSPGDTFARLWRELLAPALGEAARQFVLGPQGFDWPAPLERLAAAPREALLALAESAVPPPLEPVGADRLRRQLFEARENLLLVEEREDEYPLSTDVPLSLVKEKRRLQRRITELTARLDEMGIGD